MEHRHEARNWVKALLKSVAAAVPFCRFHAACVEYKLQSALWHFGDAGASEHFGVGKIGNHMFENLRPFLPSTARWQTPWQSPSLLYEGLEARPSWKLEDLPQDSAAHRLFLALREGSSQIAEDLRTGILSEEGKAFIRSPAWTGLHHNGEWEAFTVYRTPDLQGAPRQLDPLHCRFVPRTCRILQEARALPGLAEHLPTLQFKQEVVDFLKADPGTVVVFHAASASSRLTVQLCLTGCDDGNSYIQVGPERIYWRFGEPVVFDDSFMHSVHIDARAVEPRWVLTVQVMHPAIDTAERFAAHFASQEAAIGDERQAQGPLEGGPPPPPVPVQARPTGFPDGRLSFHNELGVDVLLYASLWGPAGDGPSIFIGKVSSQDTRPYDHGTGMTLPPLSHRARLSAMNVTNEEELAVWRIDARDGSRRHFVLPVEKEEYARRSLLILQFNSYWRELISEMNEAQLHLRSQAIAPLTSCI